jgi:hypothetical protein
LIICNLFIYLFRSPYLLKIVEIFNVDRIFIWCFWFYYSLAWWCFYETWSLWKGLKHDYIKIHCLIFHFLAFIFIYLLLFSRIYLEQSHCSNVRTLEQCGQQWRSLMMFLQSGHFWTFLGFIWLNGISLVTICFYNPTATPSGYRVLVRRGRGISYPVTIWYFQTKAMTTA